MIGLNLFWKKEKLCQLFQELTCDCSESRYSVPQAKVIQLLLPTPSTLHGYFDSVISVPKLKIREFKYVFRTCIMSRVARYKKDFYLIN